MIQPQVSGLPGVGGGAPKLSRAVRETAPAWTSAQRSALRFHAKGPRDWNPVASALICDTMIRMDTYELRAERHRCGLSLDALARSIGTSASNVSAYERGTKTPNAATLARLQAALKAGSSSPVFVHRLVTVPAAAAAIRAGLKRAWSTADLLRVVREMRSNTKHLSSEDDRALFYAQPSTTGDRRWDALLAAVTEMDSIRGSRSVPAWARGHELPHMWFVGDVTSLHAQSLANSPSSLAVRGIVLDGASLESV